MVSVAREAVSLRGEGKAGSQILATLPMGSRLSVEKDEGDWYKVKTEDGQVGWVARWMTKPATTVAARPSSGREVVGYYAESSSKDKKAYTSFARNLDTITTIAPFLYRADAHGNITGKHNPT